jgi:hypothetical protein
LTILTIAAFGFCLLGLTACTAKVDYYQYVSEVRKSIYLYEDDNMSVKLYFSSRESPYKSDGIKGEMNDIVEVYVSLNKSCNELDVAFEGFEGEMNYLAVSQNYYLCFSGENVSKDEIDVKLTIDGTASEVTCGNVVVGVGVGGDTESNSSAGSSSGNGAGGSACGEIITPRTALKCVTEYDAELFKSLTNGKIFNGEIYIRLLFNDGCYYYVGVCDTSSNITSYLVDAVTGRIIATRKG